MIHDIRREYFNLDLNRFQLTFDDGLFSQYYYYPVFSKNPFPLIYFITTSFISPGKTKKMFGGEHLPYHKSKKYMHDTFIKGVYDHFMSIGELQQLAACENIQIGAHSHFHDVILTHKQSKKKKPLSAWKLARFQNHPAIAYSPTKHAFITSHKRQVAKRCIRLYLLLPGYSQVWTSVNRTVHQ